MKKYQAYKDSGVIGIGQIPSHWDVILFKRIIDRIKDGTHGTFERVANGVPFLSAKNVFSEGLKVSKTESMISYSDHFEITKNGFPAKNDLLITCVGTIGRSFVYDIETPYSFQRSVTFIRLKFNSNPHFYKFYIQSSYYQDLLISLAKTSAQSGVYMGDLMNSISIKLPFEEQEVIAKYLDQKTSEIENLINKKKQLIALLKEERTAIINNAVTKGINPNVKMKDSGVEWIGEIPEHWEVKRMKYLCDIGTGSKDTENREENGVYPFFVRSQTVEKISTYSYNGEAILTAGDGVGVCKVWHYINGKFDYHQRVYRLSDFVGILGKFLFYYIKENFEKEVFKLSARSTVDSLRRPMFQNFMVCFGSIQEQKEIVEYIESKISEIDTIISKTEKEIELMKEYKTALISEVVTGKIDVRDEVIV